MATITLNKTNFESVVTQNNIVIIDFWAEWCGPCKSFAPTFAAVSELFPDIVFAKVDIEEEQEIATDFRIRSIPHLMVFKEKVIIFSEAGALPQAALLDLVKQAKAIDMTEVHKKIEEGD